MINPQWLELPVSRTIFYGPKDVRSIEVRLYIYIYGWRLIRITYEIVSPVFHEIEENYFKITCANRDDQYQYSYLGGFSLVWVFAFRKEKKIQWRTVHTPACWFTLSDICSFQFTCASDMFLVL